MTPHIDGLSALSGQYRALLCDVWGVLHNGVSVYRDAEAALGQFRAAGGAVVMITNSPRPRAGVIQQLDELGVSRDTYDEIVTSGDVTRELIRQADGSIFHLGPDRDKPLFDGLNASMVGEDTAAAIVCTGLFEDETETPEDYRARFEPLVARGVPFICANPDIVVERGDRLIWCAGSLARLYAEMGGETRLAGKPHAPIYALASRKVAELTGETIDKSNMLAIGDGMPTDVKGAQDFGSNLLYIAGGIHAGEYGGAENPDTAKLETFLKEQGATPDFWMSRLVW
ncbi:TIGR01459 family HAD-type hydrolase [Pseudahrensia aquimaris]|uniref:TIGR01459 family HAD-type hydrolase n=1 Tax=Pseudahrensia aquimaris TaxID=744461 RepID=A0ABW3FDZ3_9HYPH